MTLFSPYRYNIDRFQNYNITKLGNTYRNLEILENRDGEPNINLGLNFIGPCGTFREIPKASEISAEIEKSASTMYNGKPKYVKNAEDIWIKNPERC